MFVTPFERTSWEHFEFENKGNSKKHAKISKIKNGMQDFDGTDHKRTIMKKWRDMKFVKGFVSKETGIILERMCCKKGWLKGHLRYLWIIKKRRILREPTVRKWSPYLCANIVQVQAARKRRRFEYNCKIARMIDSRIEREKPSKDLTGT